MQRGRILLNPLLNIWFPSPFLQIECMDESKKINKKLSLVVVEIATINDFFLPFVSFPFVHKCSKDIPSPSSPLLFLSHYYDYRLPSLFRTDKARGERRRQSLRDIHGNDEEKMTETAKRSREMNWVKLHELIIRRTD